jgi:hypothetical protein
MREGIGQDIEIRRKSPLLVCCSNSSVWFSSSIARQLLRQAQPRIPIDRTILLPRESRGFVHNQASCCQARYCLRIACVSSPNQRLELVCYTIVECNENGNGSEGGYYVWKCAKPDWSTGSIFGSRARLPGKSRLNKTFSLFRGYCEHDLSTNGLDPESNLACFGRHLVACLLAHPRLGSELFKWGSSKDRRPDRTRRP